MFRHPFALSCGAIAGFYSALFGMHLEASPITLFSGAALSFLIGMKTPASLRFRDILVNGSLLWLGLTTLLLALHLPDKLLDLLGPYSVQLTISLFMAILAGGCFYFMVDPDTSQPIAADSPIPEPSLRDRRVVASHESGHVLMHALALPCLDESLTLSIDSLDHHDIKGYVVSYTEPHQCPSADFIEFRLMVLLAGRAAEDILLGGHTGGSRNDLNRWMRIASQYGSSCLNISLYPSPQNGMEAEANLKALSQYQEKQYRNVWRLLDDNRNVLMQLRDAALTQGSLSFGDIKPFLEQVEIPPGFPRITKTLLESA